MDGGGKYVFSREQIQAEKGKVSFLFWNPCLHEVFVDSVKALVIDNITTPTLVVGDIFFHLLDLGKYC